MLRLTHIATNFTGQISFPLKLGPTRFSYKCQHHVLAIVQQILEDACFNFTQTWLPAVLVENSWTCAAAIELTKWLNVMLKYLDTLPEDCIDLAGCNMFKTIRPCLAHLRHSVVHRLPLEPGRVLEMVDAALTLAKILRDESYSFKLDALHTRLSAIVSQRQRDTETVQNEVNQAFSAIQKHRKALDRQEQELRRSAAERMSRTLDLANSSLLDCAYDLRSVKRKEGISMQGSRSDIQRPVSDPAFYVSEGDIESDEDQLKADLG